MIEGLQPYPASAMKPMVRTNSTNIPWLGSIPSHWRVVRSNGLFAPRTERARPDDEQLAATQAYGVIPQAEFERRAGRKVVRITQHLDKRAHVEPDDFVISMRSFQGGLERAWARGCIRSSYVVLRPSTEAGVGYFAHLFKCRDYILALQATSNFIRDGQDLNMNNFRLVDLPLPPMDEQAAIARFLDHVNRKIDGFIRAKRKLITLLGEQKQAIIHSAVTRGLDPNAPLKPSGIPWLGDIPRHWEVKRIKHLLKEVDNRSTTGAEPLLSMRMHHGLVVFAEHFTRPPQAASLVGFKIVKPGQFVVNRMQAGNGVIYSSNLAFAGLVSPDYAVFDPIADVNVVYLGELFRSPTVRTKFRSESKGLGTGTSGFLRLYNDRFGAIHISLPPRREQDSILRILGEEHADLNTAIARTEREIALMQEYRTRLTADVVTGKLDVRAAAASLPDLPADPTFEPTADEFSEEAELEDMT
ncbi:MULTISPECIES: restriction endonuclease subunit S [unclassified Bradyrhizobium]|uniref:restriction endonuclease subunit S n=1 Tax=unclassified Bradyrhizobium TaxID=2631580 RepID=UPI0028E3A317|nr:MULTISPECIES: restriction endonuclease subunit S [unclassified Bradyrhizobium]